MPADWLRAGACLLLLLATSCSEADDAGAGKTRGILSPGDSLGGDVPAGAIVLGREAWVNERDKGDLGWLWRDGVLEIAPGSGNLRTRERFGDCRLHLEFKIRGGESSDWKLDGNSGVYLQRRYELQILNSHGRKPGDETCGAIYITRKPDAEASRPAGEWQSYDLVFRAPRWDGEDKVQDARLSVLHNGVLIHDDVRIPGKTGAGKEEAPSEEPLRLQDHGSAVQFRNIWIQRLQLD